MTSRQTAVTAAPHDLVTVRADLTEHWLAPHPTQGSYVERFWLPVLGPTCTMLIRLAAGCDRPVTVSMADLAASLGVETKVLARAIQRADGYGVATWADDRAVLSVPDHLPWLSMHQVGRLPKTMRHVHQQLRAAA